MFRIQLPHPSKLLIDVIKIVVNKRPLALEKQRWHEMQQPPETSCAVGDFFTDPTVTTIAKLEYEQFFDDPFIVQIASIKNNKSTISQYPAHSDRIVRVNANFYIETGGNNVETVFYDVTDDHPESEGGKVLSYNDLPAVKHRRNFSSNEWYILNARQFHSIENIETNRVALMLGFKNISFSEFEKKYKSLVEP